jgi:sulfoxide reductase heme-binding subunit YedZ
VGGTPTAAVLESPPPNLPHKGGGRAAATNAGGIAKTAAGRATVLHWRAWLGPGSWALYALGMTPAAWTFALALSDQLGADPLKVLERSLGLWALRFLILGLAITPLRRVGGPNLLRYRRTVGLLAFLYAALHVIVYLWLDQGLDLTLILKDILKRPYITVGLLSFLILIPLAATSNTTMIKRLGAQAWQRLHRWVYVAAAAAALHFIMLVKAWPAEPLIYAALVASLLAFRLVDSVRRRQPRPIRS